MVRRPVIRLGASVHPVLFLIFVEDFAALVVDTLVWRRELLHMGVFLRLVYTLEGTGIQHRVSSRVLRLWRT